MPTCCWRSKPEELESFGGGGGGSDGSEGNKGRARSPDSDDHDHGDFFSSSIGDGEPVRGNGADFGGSSRPRPRPLSCPRACRFSGSAERRPCQYPEVFGCDAGAMRCGGIMSENEALRFLCPRLRVEVE